MIAPQVLEIIKWVYRSFAFIVICALIFANYNYYKSDSLDLRASIAQQLNYIETEIHDGADEKMQEKFPEGYVFMNSLYGLTWCEFSLQNKNDVTLRTKALKEALFALGNLESDQAKKTYSAVIKPKYGIFYQGWTNYLRAKILLLSSAKMPDTVLHEFNSVCNEIEVSFKESRTPYLESYLGSSWPADMFPAIASLKIHDKLFPARYGSTIKLFLKKLKQHTDMHRLIPHKTHYVSGASIENARGSSQSLIIRLLAEIDASAAMGEYKHYREIFADQFFGLNLIREYPETSMDPRDADSGPIIFGYGGAATVVSIAASKALGDKLAADQLSASIESIGFPITNNAKKKFVFGSMPMADAFIAWSYATPNYANTGINIRHKDIKASNKFHYFSGIVLLLLIIPEILFNRLNKKKSRAPKRYWRI